MTFWLIVFLAGGMLLWRLILFMGASSSASEAQIKATLKSLWISCNVHWAESGPGECNVDIARQYGFQPDPAVTFTGGGNMDTFQVTGKFQDSSTGVTINAKGNFIKQ